MVAASDRHCLALLDPALSPPSQDPEESVGVGDGETTRCK
jgi:hypothetical protein